MKELLAKYKSTFERHLQEVLAKYQCYIQPIREAVEYSVSNGGKRIRPSLCYMAAELYKKDLDFVKNFAVGIELIHSYSLVHDDLPCMDDDELRRGMPTTHIAYGEGMAVLAGDALLNMAFEVMLSDKNFDKNMHSAMAYIANMSGMNGMIGGQCLDLANSNADMSIDKLTTINRLKTSCLMRGALVGSAIRCGANEREIAALEEFSQSLGEIFQIVDDILDRTSTKEALGKEVNQDLSNDKISIVDILGIDNAKEYIKKIEDIAIKAIEPFGDGAQKLKDFCKFLSNRVN